SRFLSCPFFAGRLRCGCRGVSFRFSITCRPSAREPPVTPRRYSRLIFASAAGQKANMRTDLLRFNGAVERDPAIDAWMKEHAAGLGGIAHQWFAVMRKCGDEVRELLHDGCPVACLGDAPFGYVNVFTSHVNVGFFHGAALPDPARLLQGTGKFMRHVKL